MSPLKYFMYICLHPGCKSVEL